MKTCTVTLSEIEWDCDDHSVNLPSSMRVHISTEPEDDADEDDIANAAMDVATNITGWCILDCNMKTTET